MYSETMKVTFSLPLILTIIPPLTPKTSLGNNRITYTKSNYNHYVTTPFQGMYPCIHYQPKQK